MTANKDIDIALKRVFERIEKDLDNPIDESEIMHTTIYKHYKDDILKMEVDLLLDWRLELEQFKATRGYFPAKCFDDEIKCVDWLLNKIN